MRLHGYFRSTASWRVRIALNLKGVSAEHVFHHLRRGAQQSPEYVRLNPQGLVPTLETDDNRIITQSLAICEWLDETLPQPPLLPGNPLERARTRAFALAIACDIHPVQNLKVLARLRSMSIPEGDVTAWAAWVIRDGLVACAKLLDSQPGPFCFGSLPTLGDICLVPQLYNARRFGCDLSGLQRLLVAEAACLDLPAFVSASPEHQTDAE
jgi:maleylpyruvate isomerase